MKAERWQQLEGIFHAALEREPSQRAAYLKQPRCRRLPNMEVGWLVLVLTGFLGFLPAPSQDRVAPLKIQVGQAAPDFTLPAADGSEVRLSSLRGHNVLLDFYRGYW